MSWLESQKAVWWWRVVRNIVSFGGWVGFAAALLLYSAQDSGAPAYDAHAYWLAGAHLLAGQPLYGLAGQVDYGAYRYPPVFALVFAPFSLLPSLAFDWGWRLLELLALRYLTGSWRRVGYALWFPPVIAELIQANVALLSAAVVFAALRGRAAALLPVAGVLKVGPILALPHVWLAWPGQRRPLILGLTALLAACAVSSLVAPAAWPDYLDYLANQARSTSSLSPLMMLPGPALDFAVRTALGVAIVLIGLRQRARALVFLATILAVPVLWPASLAPLVAMPRLLGNEQVPDALTEGVRRPRLRP